MIILTSSAMPIHGHPHQLGILPPVSLPGGNSTHASCLLRCNHALGALLQRLSSLIIFSSSASLLLATLHCNSVHAAEGLLSKARNSFVQAEMMIRVNPKVL